MKHVLAILIAFLATSATAQTTTYPEPDFANVPMWYDASASSLKSLERATPNRGARVSGMASAESLVFFENESSTVQFQKGKLPPFIFKMTTSTEDPAGILECAQMQVNKHKHQREYIIGKAGMAGSKSTLQTIQLDFKKLGNGVYLVSPSQPLEAGEYGFSVGKKAFLFSIQ